MIDKLMKSPTWDLAKENGVYIGIANPNVPVFIDPWSKCIGYAEDSNIVKMGVSGVGMCFTAKLKEARKRGLKKWRRNMKKYL